MRFHQHIYQAAVLAALVAGSVSAADWGDLTAKFVLDGAAPTAKALEINKDQQVCGKFNLVDEQLVVNPANKGIANVVVFLYLPPTEKKVPPIHDSYKETEKGSVKLDNKNCRFEPRVVALRTTQTLLVGNPDPVAHNTNVTTLRNPGANLLIPPSASLKFNFPLPESLPIPASCSIHPWMKCYVVIKDHPYVGVSDADGNLTIKNVPAGKWTFQFWQESSGFVTKAKQNNKPVDWMRGRTELTIKAGMNDLGEIKIPVASFKL